MPLGPSLAARKASPARRLSRWFSRWLLHLDLHRDGFRLRLEAAGARVLHLHLYLVDAGLGTLLHGDLAGLLVDGKLAGRATFRAPASGSRFS